MDKLNVAIADDNERVVQLLEHIVSSDDELAVVGKAGNGEDLVDIIKKKQPDVVLLDIIMPKVDGLSVMDRVNRDKEIKNIQPLSSSLPLDRKRSQRMPLIWERTTIF